jgi:Rieske Fe-S protein
MSIFGNIMDKIFRRGSARAAPAPTAAPAPQAAPAVPRQATPAATAPIKPAPAPVDVEAVLSELAAAKGGGGNWRSSIVDLLKLLDLDSSLAARKELAEELEVNAGEPGSAAQNIALHKAVMRQLAANGGTVPASLRD